MLGGTAIALADPWKDESGKGRSHRELTLDNRGYSAGEHKEEFRSRGCKVERKWERDGGYKEEVKCDGPRGRR